jgi:lipooligosaccharide transport system permease protein
VNALKVVRRNYLVFWRAWRWSLFLSVLSPVMFLSAMGLGIGGLIQQNDTGVFGSAGYLAFFATGMLAVTCMQTGAFNGSYPIMNKIVWQRNYEAMLATPLQPRDLFLGELTWSGVMLTLQALPFFLVMNLFGVPASGSSILAVPAAVLVGLGFCAAVMAWTATLEKDLHYNWLFRFVLTPLFLLSGTFFPIETLPSWATVLANATPLYHSIELVRGFMLEPISSSATVWHTGYLTAFLLVATSIGIKNLNRRLVP